MVGEKVVLRTRMSAGDAHYAGELVEGAHIVTAWGDVGTELAIRLFGDESLFLGYSYGTGTLVVKKQYQRVEFADPKFQNH